MLFNGDALPLIPFFKKGGILFAIYTVTEPPSIFFVFRGFKILFAIHTVTKISLYL